MQRLNNTIMANIPPTLFTPRKFIFGSDPAALKPLPLRDFPRGKARLRIRADCPVFLFLVADGVARQFLVEEKDGYWCPGPEVARNVTMVNPTT